MTAEITTEVTLDAVRAELNKQAHLIGEELYRPMTDECDVELDGFFENVTVCGNIQRAILKMDEYAENTPKFDSNGNEWYFPHPILETLYDHALDLLKQDDTDTDTDEENKQTTVSDVVDKMVELVSEASSGVVVWFQTCNQPVTL